MTHYPLTTRYGLERLSRSSLMIGTRLDLRRLVPTGIGCMAEHIGVHARTYNVCTSPAQPVYAICDRGASSGAPVDDRYWLPPELSCSIRVASIWSSEKLAAFCAGG